MIKNKIYLITAICLILCPVYSIAKYKITIMPQITVSNEYTGNVFLSKNGQQDDFITLITPKCTFEASAKAQGAIISYSPSYSYYHKYPDYNTLRHNLSATAWMNISKITKLSATNSLLRTEDPDIAEDDSTIRRTRNVYLTNSTRLNLSHQFGNSDSINLGYGYSFAENTDPNIADNLKHNASVGFSHKFSSKLNFDTGVSYTRGEFSNIDDVNNDFDHWSGNVNLSRQITKYLSGSIRYAHTIMQYDGDNENYQIYDPSIGLNYTIDEGTRLAVNIGYFIQDREKSEDESGISISSNIGKTWKLRRGSINITGSSGYGESYFGAESLGFNIYYQGQCNFDYSLTKNISSGVFISCGKTDYSNTENDREDIRMRTGFNFNIKIPSVRWLSIVIGYSYSEVDSTDDDKDFKEDRGQCNVVMFPAKIFRLN